MHGQTECRIDVDGRLMRQKQGRRKSCLISVQGREIPGETLALWEFAHGPRVFEAGFKVWSREVRRRNIRSGTLG